MRHAYFSSAKAVTMNFKIKDFSMETRRHSHPYLPQQFGAREDRRKDGLARFYILDNFDVAGDKIAQ